MQTWDDFVASQRDVATAFEYTPFPTPITGHRPDLATSTVLGLKITAPAAANPFSSDSSFSGYQVSPSSFVSSPVFPNIIDNSPFVPMNAHLTPRGSWDSIASQSPQAAQPGQVDTIDPRWVSPLSSLFPTPIGTPRVGSPVMPHFPELPYHPGIAETPIPQTMPAYAFMGAMPHNGLVDTTQATSPANAARLATQSYPPRHPERPRTLYNPGSFGSTSASTNTGSDSVFGADLRALGV